MGKGRTRSRRRVTAALAAGVVTASLLTACGSGGGNTVTIYMYPEDHFQTTVDKCNQQAGGRYHIVYNKLPRTADGQREQLVRRLAAGDSSLDILGLDVTWVPEFAEAGWIDEWTGQNKAEAQQGVLPGPLETAVWNGKLYAAPKHTNVQLLWYDDRITPNPPTTWDDMIAQAEALKAQGKPHNILFTGAQYEGLVVVYNTLVESAGGHILSNDGKSVVMDAGAIKGLELLKKVTTAGITDPSLTNQKEDEVRQAFQRGNGAFELNWPFVYASYAEDDAANLSHFKWATYPQVVPGTPARTTIGGIDLAVSSYSKHKAEAFQATLCLRSQESQKFAALNDGVPPVDEALYTDNTPLDPSKPVNADNNPSMQTAYPMRDAILAALKTAAVRPLTPAYQSLSTVMSKVLSPPSQIDPQRTADELRKQLSDALQSKGVIP
ncbi:ABC transporter substrate-binding protein [Amycolatopsis alkalitolerans]|uniref:ABC transporter substrate-binding protein n=1 Tax=Amycolatopsis alkalitolerans TaxID=2547244 RepID=A0A5C4LYZ5_9PSEU|nr:ABC transporter substrate-binding protein [Amycolatopsis alkalitolerans]TNC23223.1 ABC transporter substrate-binding protein [Amycolatopsis alkalitolerans]